MDIIYLRKQSSRDTQALGYEPDSIPPLVDLVEGIIARDEREGGRTMRELSELIVERVLAYLVAQGVIVAR